MIDFLLGIGLGAWFVITGWAAYVHATKPRQTHIHFHNTENGTQIWRKDD